MGIGKWIKKGAVSFSLATTNVEKNALSQEANSLDEGTQNVTPIGQNSLMNDLKQGHLTEQVKQFREHHYMVLKESEKFKAKWGKDGDFEMLNEEEVSRRKVAKGDPYDSYPVEVSVDNREVSSGIYESVSSTRRVKVRRGVFPKCKIEEHTDLVTIRDIDGKNKLVEFHISINKPENRLAILEARHLMTNPGVRDFNNITNLNFTTTGGNGLHFEYKMLAFDKVVEYNGNYIVKMFAEQVGEATWIGQKYMLG